MSVSELDDGDLAVLQNHYVTLMNDPIEILHYAAQRKLSVVDIYIECKDMIKKIGIRRMKLISEHAIDNRGLELAKD